jgi:hypothetical protein
LNRTRGVDADIGKIIDAVVFGPNIRAGAGQDAPRIVSALVVP